jgi:FHA domain-containing protein
MQSPSYRLIVRRGPQPNQVYELSTELSNLGRDITNDIVINDREVSRHHLRLTLGSDGLTIEDLGSTNGTFVNGKRVTGTISLKNGDMLGLGETVTLQYEAVQAGAAAPPPAAAQPPAETAPTGTADDDRYRPQPQQTAPPPQAAASVPQADPAQQQGEAAQQQYQPPDAYAPSQDHYAQQGGQAAGYGPPPPGYDYDPYAMRDEEGNSMQWVLIGCLGLLLFCCCALVVLSVAVDTFCLYDSVPGLSGFIRGVTSIFPDGPYLPNCASPLG